MTVNCSVADDKNGGKKGKKTNDENKHLGAPRDYHSFDKKNTFRKSVTVYIYDTSRREGDKSHG